jgi:penicillin-binding protein 2
VVLLGLLILVGGLWWVQLISSRHFQEKLETQSIRTIRIPAIRGKILDREGRVLAENRPTYNINLYVEGLSKNFQAAYAERVKQLKKIMAAKRAERRQQLGRDLTKLELKEFAVTESMKNTLQRECRTEVARSATADLSARLQQPVAFDEKKFS